jgi:8-oxo-dGTP pyrophosphatase MutT (NUDIX family)
MDRFTAILARRCAAYEPTRLVMRPRAGLRRAAVLCPIVDVAGQPAVLFTVRAAHLRSQPGQVAFPGGHCEPGEGPAQAAVRETLEELGVAADAPFALHDDGFAAGGRHATHVTPAVGVIRGDFSSLDWLPLAADEVGAAFALTLRHMADPAHSVPTLLHPRGPAAAAADPAGRTLAVPSYLGGPAPVFGFTAFLLHRMMTTVLLPSLREWEEESGGGVAGAGRAAAAAPGVVVSPPLPPPVAAGRHAHTHTGGSSRLGAAG